jgi:hypothetical protein
VQLVQQLCERQPDLLQMLLQMPGGYESAAVLRSGFGTALSYGLLEEPAADEDEEDVEGGRRRQRRCLLPGLGWRRCSGSLDSLCGAPPAAGAAPAPAATCGLPAPLPASASEP